MTHSSTLSSDCGQALDPAFPRQPAPSTVAAGGILPVLKVPGGGALVAERKKGILLSLQAKGAEEGFRQNSGTSREFQEVPGTLTHSSRASWNNTASFIFQEISFTFKS